MDTQEILRNARYESRLPVKKIPKNAALLASEEHNYRRDTSWFREELWRSGSGRLYLYGIGNSDSPYAFRAGETWGPGERVYMLNPKAASGEVRS